jgi:hypothetical protein
VPEPPRKEPPAVPWGGVEPKKEPAADAPPPPVWAVGKALEIKPAALPQERSMLPLPSSVRDVCAGGGGRFLILYLPQQRSLALFDTSAAKIAKYLPMAGDDVKFAAGMEKLVVALPDKNVLQRWDLTSFERELTAVAPVQGAVQVLLMGSASAGPLVVAYGGEARHGGDGPRFAGTGCLFLNPANFKEVKYKVERFHGMHPHSTRASADGTVFAGSNDWQGSCSAVLRGSSIVMYHEGTAALLRPAADGRTLCGMGGPYTPELKKLGGSRLTGETVPAVQGGLYLSVTYSGDRFGGAGGKPSVAVHLAGDSRPLLTLADLPGLENPGNPWDAARGGVLPLDKRLFLIPAAKLLVTIPSTADRLHLIRFDLEEALEKSGIDYLFVTSQPPPQFTPGQKFTYPVAVKSKKGGVKVKLESGPAGMNVSAAGLVSWAVPAAFADAEVDVLLTVSDASGQEIFHTFKVAARP